MIKKKSYFSENSIFKNNKQLNVLIIKIFTLLSNTGLQSKASEKKMIDKISLEKLTQNNVHADQFICNNLTKRLNV